MKLKKYLVPILAVSLFFLSACGKKRDIGKKEENTQKAVLQPSTDVEEKEEEAPSVISYIVKLSGKTLSLYEMNGEKSALVTSMEINPEFYPKEDIDKLTKGISAYCKEEGYEILENFAN